MKVLTEKHNNFIKRKNIAPVIPQPAGANLHAQRAQVQQILNTLTPQAKVTIGAPNDKYEQKADRVADQFMGIPEPQVQRDEAIDEDDKVPEPIRGKPLTSSSAPLIQCLCPECKDELKRQLEEEPDNELLQEKAQTGATPEVSPEAVSGIRFLQGGGQPLSDADCSFFEPRFGQDFSSVRIHADSKANQLARSVNARAFTLGEDIVFAGGEYQPESKDGKRLMAHELTHVVQQVQAAARVERIEQDGERVPDIENTQYTLMRARQLQRQARRDSAPHPLDRFFLNNERQRRYADGKVMYILTSRPPGILQDIISAQESHTGSTQQGIRKTIAYNPATTGGADRTRLVVVRGVYLGSGTFDMNGGHVWNIDTNKKGEWFREVTRKDRNRQPFTIIRFEARTEGIFNASNTSRPVVNIGWYLTPGGRPSGSGRLKYVERYDYLDSSYLGSVVRSDGSWTWSQQAPIPNGHAGQTWADILNERLLSGRYRGFHELVVIDEDGSFDDSDRPYRTP